MPPLLGHHSLITPRLNAIKHSNMSNIFSLKLPACNVHIVNSIFRNVSEMEIKSVAEGIIHILNCQGNKLPAEVISHRFIHQLTPNSMEDVRSCVRRPGKIAEWKNKKHHNNHRKKTSKNKIPIKNKYTMYVIPAASQSELCKKKLSGVCGRHRFLNDMNLKKCKLLVDKRNKEISKFEKEQFNISGRDEQVVNNYTECMENVEEHVQPCRAVFIETCNSSDIRSIKSIRWNMDIVRKVLELDPEVKMIHLYRDPRGIVSSIRNAEQFSLVSGGDINEAKVVCAKMEQDMKKRKQLELLYPNQIYSLRFEDFAGDPVKEAKKLYSWLGLSLHYDVQYYFRTQKGRKRDGGTFSTQRNNSKSVIYKWRNVLSDKEKEQISSFCKLTG